MNDNISMQRQKYGGFIQLLPNEIYFQISNSSNDISFDDDISVSLVDTCGNSLKSLMYGLEFNYLEFLNTFTEKNNIVFEFFVNQDFGRELLLLKLKNNITGATWFSTPFQCTENLKAETSFFMYKDEEFLKGVNYELQNYFQSIRLTCFKNDINEEVENEEYTQLSGNKIYARNVITNVDQYKFYMADWFTFKRLSFVLDHSIIYINKYRAFSSPGKISKGERVEDSNLITLDFDVNPTEEYKDYEAQLSIDLIYSDAITYNFIYSHEPENDPNSGEWFLSNLLFNNYHNAFGIIYNCDLQVVITKIPVKGFIANNFTRQIYNVGDFISYCEKDNLVYFPNGFNNDLGVVGNYGETFGFKIVDQTGRYGKDTIHTINMTDSAAPEIEISASISFDDNTSSPKEGNAGSIVVKLVDLIFDPSDPIVTQQWEVFDGANWIFYADKTGDNQTIALPYLSNQIRYKAVSQFSVTAYSNYLSYTKISSANLSITDVVQDPSIGITTYKLHVENEAFDGFVNMFGMKNFNGRSAFIDDDNGGRLFIPASNDMTEVYKSIPISLGIGVYELTMAARGLPKSLTQDVSVDGGVSYGYTPIYNDSNVICAVSLFIAATSIPETP